MKRKIIRALIVSLSMLSLLFQPITAQEKSKEELFIEKIAPFAQELARENDLYASIMIAQACQESGFGTSSLSQEPTNNLFGVKGLYNGQGKTFTTKEDDGEGGLYEIKSTFRAYPSYLESLVDYATVVLKKPIYYGAWKSNTNSYQQATKHLTGLYASDTKYFERLDNLIERFQLTKYDKETGTLVLPMPVIQTVAKTEVTKNEIICSEKGISEFERNNTKVLRDVYLSKK